MGRRFLKNIKTTACDQLEKKHILYYLETFLSKKVNIKDFLPQIGEWFHDHGADFVKYSLIKPEEFEQYDTFKSFVKANKTEAIRRIEEIHVQILKKIAKTNLSKISNLQNKINLVSELLKLSDIERSVLAYYVRLKFNPDMMALKEAFFCRHLSRCNHATFFLPHSAAQIETATTSSGKLISCGLLEIEYDGDIELGSRGCRLFLENFKNLAELKKIILGPKLIPELEWQDFMHISDKDFCLKLLKRAITAKLKGFNILLYGEPGTGKTEFTKALCKQAHIELYAVGEKTDDPNRLECLNMIKNTICKNDKLCLLIDEADDLMSEKKICINRILENNETPCIWIVNSIRYWDKAYLRRFTFAMDFKKPNVDVRKEIFKKILKQYNLQIDKQKVGELATEYALPPSFIMTAVKSAKLLKGGIDEVRKNLDSLEKAYNNGMDKPKNTEKKKEEQKAFDFNVSLLNTDIDLGKLCTQIKELKKTKFSLCLYGVSGTGKSAYGEYLAHELKMPVIKKRCSDLLSMWHGETEQNIARAFTEAKEKNALLIFDEADSFLYNRQNATHSWEVAEVGEMLTQMEKHELPFVCTTNLMENLDKASLRRFTFKVEYKYMAPEQNTLAFKHFFGIEGVDLSHISTLTPADFVVTKEKAEIMGCMDNKDELIKMLEAEQKQKAAPTTRHIGFF